MRSPGWIISNDGWVLTEPWRAWPIRAFVGWLREWAEVGRRSAYRLAGWEGQTEFFAMWADNLERIADRKGW